MNVPRSTAVLVATSVHKDFAGVHALRDVSLEVRSGEVLALMGENGAGKSTLLKILGGDHQPDRGALLLDGKHTVFGSPGDARRAGVRVIAQEPEIVPHVSVAENVYIGALPARLRRFQVAELCARVERDIERWGFHGVLSAGQLGSRLSAAQRQVVEILRALVSEPQVVAFDEPTSSLSDHETEVLFRLIELLRAKGTAVVYVSHRMHEIFRIADRIAVLRDGGLVGVQPAREVREDDLVRMMVGRDLSAMFERRRAPGTQEVLRLEQVTTEDVVGVDLEVHAGEVVVLAGLIGAGRTELCKAVVGDVPVLSGRVLLNGKHLRLRSPRDAVRAGIGFAPEERKAEALILGRSVRDNVSLATLERLRRFRVVRRDRERALVAEQVTALRIRTPTVEEEVRKLSGGNQQKVVLARWLARAPKLLVLDEPTRGVDVGAKAEIYAVVDRLASAGMGVLVVSSDLPEVLGLADRVLVMRAGRVVGELSRSEATEQRILTLALGEAGPPGPAPYATADLPAAPRARGARL